MHKHHWLLLAGMVVLLSACGHSRIVRRDYPAEPSSAVRGAHAQAASPSRAVTEPLPRNAIHVVRAGETLYGISFRYGLRYQDVAAWNGFGNPYVIEIGQRLRLRPDAGTRAQAFAPPPPARVSPSAPIQHLPAPDIGSQSIAGGPRWSWPARGQIIGRYVIGDQTQQGINIAGSAGQDVVAAADGIVVYSGAGLVGYGELIIIKHSDEWLSAYAHNRRRRVGEGTRVKSGDVIAEMGRTGAIRDMLHFEIRRNGKPVDPLLFLPKP